ncbi:unnamed protein product [Trifolium pratense]|uniref:Uncharacterized protein n=1 Tax=Trifolium pratense TaxID=57577 RepID=A0ACB0M0Q5_TRIPR|nr:unnamed protein product [Trifolium pratense]
MKTNTIGDKIGEWKWETGKGNWERNLKNEDEDVCMREDVHMKELFKCLFFTNKKKK